MKKILIIIGILVPFVLNGQIKFSSFTLDGTIGGSEYIVGYSGSDNIRFAASTWLDAISDSCEAVRTYADDIAAGGEYWQHYSLDAVHRTLYPYKYTNYLRVMIGNQPYNVFDPPYYTNPYHLYVDGTSYFTDSVQFAGILSGVQALTFKDTSGTYTLSDLTQTAWNTRLTENKWIDLNGSYHVTISDTTTDSPYFRLNANSDIIHLYTEGIMYAYGNHIELGNDSVKLIYNSGTDKFYVRDYRTTPLGLEYYTDYYSTLWNNDNSIPSAKMIKDYITDSVDNLSTIANNEIVYRDGSGNIDGFGYVTPGLVTFYRDIESDANNAFRLRHSSSISKHLPTYSFREPSDSTGFNSPAQGQIDFDSKGTTYISFTKDSLWTNVPITGNHGIAGIVDTTGFPVDNGLAYFTDPHKIGSALNIYTDGYRLSFGVLNSGNPKPVLVGYNSGNSSMGLYNTAIGAYTLANAGSGASDNTAIGFNAGNDITTGDQNVFIGLNSASHTTSGINNVAIGKNTLINNLTGSGNIAIGGDAGYYETGSNKLYIENSGSTSPLIYGDFLYDSLIFNGTVTIMDSLRLDYCNMVTRYGWLGIDSITKRVFADSLVDAGFVFEKSFKIPTIKERLNDTKNGELAYYYKKNGKIIKEYTIKGSPGITIQKLQASDEITIKQIEALEERIKYLEYIIIENKLVSRKERRKLKKE